MNNELSTNEYWSDLWDQIDTSSTYIFDRKDAAHAVNYYKHLLLKEYFTRYLKEGNVDFIEIGCGASQFLPYISKEFGFDIYGLDYSDSGCKTAQLILEKAGVTGTIILGDMYEKANEYAERFDVVYTGGVIEHFEDTMHVVNTISHYAKKGGLVVTTLPNTWKKSLTMRIQKFVGKEIYDIHKELTVKDIEQAHINAGLEVLFCKYFCFISLGTVNFISERAARHPKCFKILEKMVVHSSHIIYYIAKALHLPPNKFTSPSIVCIARKREKLDEEGQDICHS